MYIFSTLYKTLLDALFPLSEAEHELFLLQPGEAYEELPRAPGYEGLAVPLQNVNSVFGYKDERVAKLVWNIKYKKSAHAVQIGGYALWKKLLAASAERAVNLIIPMPITSRRRKERGYNQCELLVDEIERLINSDNPRNLTYPTSSRFIIEKNLLIRTHHVSRQTLKGRKDRVESSQGIFEVNEEVIKQLKIQKLDNSMTTEIEKMPILIIDDVITTGSTMFEAIETFKKAGFENVRGLSLAH